MNSALTKVALAALWILRRQGHLGTCFDNAFCHKVRCVLCFTGILPRTPVLDFGMWKVSEHANYNYNFFNLKNFHAINAIILIIIVSKHIILQSFSSNIMHFGTLWVK